jgi:hypothetical protein
MRQEICNLCPDITCIECERGRTVVNQMTDVSSFTNVPIKDCETRQAFRMDLAELEDAHGNSPPILLGC